MAIQIRDRDRLLMKMVNDFQVVSIDHLLVWFFGSYKYACQRLAQLITADYLRQHNELSPRVFTIGRAGERVLADIYGYTSEDINRAGDQVRNPKSLYHLLDISTIRANFVKACMEDEQVSLVEWKHERYFRSVRITTKVKAETKPVYPDSYFQLLDDTDHHYFLEADNNTEDLRQIKRQMQVYKNFYDNGDYERIFGTKKLRVLWVTKSERRVEQLKRVACQVGRVEMYLYSTYEAVQPEVLLHRSVWQETNSANLRPLIRE